MRASAWRRSSISARYMLTKWPWGCRLKFTELRVLTRMHTCVSACTHGNRKCPFLFPQPARWPLTPLLKHRVCKLSKLRATLTPLRCLAGEVGTLTRSHSPRAPDPLPRRARAQEWAPAPPHAAEGLVSHTTRATLRVLSRKIKFTNAT